MRTAAIELRGYRKREREMEEKKASQKVRRVVSNSQLELRGTRGILILREREMDGGRESYS